MTKTFCDHCQTEITADTQLKPLIVRRTPEVKLVIKLESIPKASGYDLCRYCVGHAINHGELPALPKSEQP